MPRAIRLSLLCALALVAAMPASGTVSDKRKQIHDKIGALENKVTHARHQKAVLTTQISRITGRIRLLQGEIASQSERLAGLQRQLAKHERILNRLNAD